MNHHEPLKSEKVFESPDQKKGGIQDFINRQIELAAQNGQLTSIDKIQQLSQNGEHEQLDALLDDLVYEALENDDEFTSNRQKVMAARSAGREDSPEIAEIIGRQREIMKEYRNDLAVLSGLPSEMTADHFAESKQRIIDHIGHHIDEGGSPDDILLTLGILEKDDDGLERYAYPRGLFPEETDKKWDVYLTSVRNHVLKQRAVDQGVAASAEIEPLDHVRRMAHNAVTKDVHELLGLDKLPQSQWGFAETRKMLAKARDGLFPTIETAERTRTASNVARAANAMGILSAKQSAKLSGLYEGKR